MRLTHIGAAVEAERLKQGLSRHTLAVKVDVTANTIFNIERAEDYNPSLDVLMRVLDALGLELSDVGKVA
jgi:transcriptional regulator with XRE-family HTH domain